MTDQYLQESINDPNNPKSLERWSFDQRNVDGLVPGGTTASYQKLKIPGPVRLSQLSWSSVLAPAVGETIELRLFRVRPASNLAGFGFIQLNSTFTISPATFVGAGDNVDISGLIIPNLCVLNNEYLACSWVHAGGPTLQPLNMNWNFTPIGAGEEEPPATTTNYADVFG